MLLLHGFPGGEEDVLGLGQAVSQRGVNALAFNARGIYRSEGTFSMERTLQDIGSALEYLHQEEVVRAFRIGASKPILGGWSYGGGMALTYAASHPEIERVFSIAGTDHGEFAREYARNPALREMIDPVFDRCVFPTGPVRFEGSAVLRALAQNPDPYDLRLSAPALADRDLLLIGGWDDSNVSIDHHVLPLYRALVREGATSVRIVAFQDDHDFGQSRPALARTIVDWIKRPDAAGSFQDQAVP